MSGNTQKESYYLTATYDRSGSAEVDQLSAEARRHAKPRYFYKTEDRQLAEQLVELFAEKLGRDSDSDQPERVRFGVRPAYELDKAKRFLISAKAKLICILTFLSALKLADNRNSTHK